ncbi:MAG: NAD(P)/FAD-dependent oxidoreductase [Casimicrobiaceae bacterium]|nr:NAD(P)/FAD-dependent oxidoreductase [Casimicrobiaceae bacterium]
MDRVDAVVIGAGVVGLACARALALAGREVLVLEAERAIGQGTSSRSSEVIHAGLYYPTGSLKARLCVEGKHLLYAYCAERGIAHRRLGKLIVATRSEDVARLETLLAQGHANGVEALSLIDGTAARRLEPALYAVAALWSQSTGIVDSHGLMLALEADLERAVGLVALRVRVERIARAHGGWILTTADGTALFAAQLVNAAGLGAVALARRTEGLNPALVPQAHFAKGNYFALAVAGGRAPFARLIYPVPEPGGLGIHLTLDLAGCARFGPDVEWLDPATTESFRYDVEPSRAEAFYRAIRRYWPQLPDGALAPAYAGIRPKIVGPGEPAADFMIQDETTHGLPGLVNLFGIESPGLTSALAIAREVLARLA